MLQVFEASLQYGMESSQEGHHSCNRNYTRSRYDRLSGRCFCSTLHWSSGNAISYDANTEHHHHIIFVQSIYFDVLRAAGPSPALFTLDRLLSPFLLKERDRRYLCHSTRITLVKMTRVDTCYNQIPSKNIYIRTHS